MSLRCLVYTQIQYKHISCYFKVSWNNKINKIILYSNYNMNSNNSMLIVQYPMQFSIWMDSWISKITTVLMMERGEYLTKTIFKQYGSIYYTKFAYVYIYIYMYMCVCSVFVYILYHWDTVYRICLFSMWLCSWS